MFKCNIINFRIYESFKYNDIIIFINGNEIVIRSNFSYYPFRSYFCNFCHQNLKSLFGKMVKLPTIFQSESVSFEVKIIF